MWEKAEPHPSLPYILPTEGQSLELRIKVLQAFSITCAEFKAAILSASARLPRFPGKWAPRTPKSAFYIPFTSCTNMPTPL